MTKTLKTLGALFLGVLFVLAMGVNTTQAETFSDLTVTGDARFQYPIYADGGLIQFNGGDLRMVDFNQGGSRIYNKGDLHLVTDDNLYFDFSNVSGLSMAEFASRMTVNDNFIAMFPIYATGNEIVFNGGGVATKTADGTPRIYKDKGGSLRIIDTNLHIDVGTVTMSDELEVGGNLSVTGTSTYTGNTTFNGTVTINDTSSAAFWNKGESTLAGDVWAEDYFYMQDGSGGDAIRWDYGIATADTLSMGVYDAGTATTTVVLEVSNTGNFAGYADLTVTGATGANLVATTGSNDISAAAGAVTITAVGATAGDVTITVGDDYTNTVTGAYLDTVTGTYGVDATGAVTVDSDAAMTLGAAGFDIDADGTSNIAIDTADGSIAITAGNSSNGDVTITATDDLSLLGGSPGSIINIGTNTEGNVINVATDNGTADDLNIGNDNASTTVAITGGDDWSITDAGAAVFDGGLDALGTIILGDGTGTVAIDTTSWDVSDAGVASGFTGITSTGAVDFSGATLELPNGTALPGTCSVGQIFADTDSDDCADTGAGDGALCICKTADTWALIANY